MKSQTQICDGSGRTTTNKSSPESLAGMPYTLPQREAAKNGENQQFYRNTDTEIWPRHGQGDQTYFTPDFDVSYTTAGSRCHARRQNPSKRNKRLFTAWIVKLNDDNRLVVEGSLECGRRARTKPIAERLSALTILSKFKHEYHLVGNMADPQYELPGFVRHRFQVGFPEDWEIVVGIWKSFITPGPNGEMRSSCISGCFAVEKKRKLAVESCVDSHCFVECTRKVDGVDSKTQAKNRDLANENIENIGYHENSKQSRTMINPNTQTSVVDYESHDDPRSRTINDIKQLTGWTPFVVPDEPVEYSLVFRGILLSSMGHPVNKNHVTDAVRRRISARIIETVNQEMYELIGDINNTKRAVPKELVTWCRYGCPKHIHSFCKEWRMLKNDETKFRKPSTHGEMNESQGQGVSPTIRHDKSANYTKSDGTNSSSTLQPERENNKRKRMPMQLNDNYNTGDVNDTTYKQKLGPIFNNSRDRSWPKIRRKGRANLLGTSRRDTDIGKGEDLKIVEQLCPSATHKNMQPSSPLKQASKQVPYLSYVYHTSAPLTAGILSDGV